jgi:hypothetical protein
VPEQGSAAAAASGVAAFALLTTAGLAGGLGVLALLRTPADPVRRLLLAPFAATLVWALTGNLLVRFGLTMAQATPLIALVSLGLAVVGIGAAARLRLPPAVVATLAAGLGLAVAVVTWPYFARGLTAHLGSPNLDTASYTSIAVALWRYGLDVSASQPPFFERLGSNVAALGPARNHSYLLLGLFSPLVEPGEPVFVRNVLVCWSILVLASSLAFYRAAWDGASEGREASSWEILFYVLATAGIGWAVVPALVGNWDNGLFVSVGPVLAGLAAEAPRCPGYSILLGATIAYAGYTYPELAPFLALFLLPLYVPALQARATGSRTLRAYAPAGLTAAILLLPGVMPLTRYFLGQVHEAGASGLRPGGSFASELVNAPLDPSAWWALGTTTPRWGWLCALALTALALAGLVSLARRRRWAEVTTIGLVGASLGYYVLADRYGYAAYKILSVSWWLVGHCLVAGCGVLVAAARAQPSSSRAGRLRHGLAVGALAAVLLTSLLFSERRRARVFFDETTFRRQPTLAALARLRAAAAGQSPMDVLVTGTSFDYSTLPWVFYALKDTPLRPYHRWNLTPPVPGGAGLAPDGPVPASLLLRSAEVPGLPARFRTPEFALVSLKGMALVEHVDSPNQLEPWGTWLGTRPITVSVLADPGSALTLTFEAAPGPSRPETPRRTLVLQAGTRPLGRFEIDGQTRIAVPFVTAGSRETLTLSTPDTPTLAMTPNGDTRPLLVSIRDLKITPRPPRPGLASERPPPADRR